MNLAVLELEARPTEVDTQVAIFLQSKLSEENIKENLSCLAVGEGSEFFRVGRVRCPRLGQT